jgi:hypothetical protein
VRFAHVGEALPPDLVNPITNIIKSSGKIAGGDILKVN